MGSLYVFDHDSQVGASVAMTDNENELWHRRLRHMSKKGLEVMVKRDQLPGLKSVDLDFCHHCLYGKQKRVNFLKIGREKSTSPLELVYSDVFGPTEVTSLGGANYFITFLDDCTRKA